MKYFSRIPRQENSKIFKTNKTMMIISNLQWDKKILRKIKPFYLL